MNILNFLLLFNSNFHKHAGIDERFGLVATHKQYEELNRLHINLQIKEALDNRNTKQILYLAKFLKDRHEMLPDISAGGLLKDWEFEI